MTDDKPGIAYSGAYLCQWCDEKATRECAVTSDSISADGSYKRGLRVFACDEHCQKFPTGATEPPPTPRSLKPSKGQMSIFDVQEAA